MAILCSILGFLKSVLQGVRKGTKKASAIISTLKGALLGIFISCFLIIAIIGSMTVAVGDMFSWLRNKFPGQEYHQIIDKLSDKDMEEMKKLFGDAFNVKKIKGYAKEEIASVESSVQAKSTTIKDGKESISNYNLDVSSITNKYKTRWQLIAALDILRNTANDTSNNEVVDMASSSIRPVFDWGYDKYSEDTTDYTKLWEVTSTIDPEYNKGQEVINSDGYSSAAEHYITKKIPLAYPTKISTPFKTYNYKITEDVVVKNENWSKKTLVSEVKIPEKVPTKKVDDKTKPIYGEPIPTVILKDIKTGKKKSLEVDKNNIQKPNYVDPKDVFTYHKGVYEDDNYIFTNDRDTKQQIKIPKKLINYYKFVDGDYKVSIEYVENIVAYEQKQLYKEVVHITRTYKSVKRKVVKDVISSITETDEPSRFITYINNLNVSVNDIDMLQEIAVNLPDALDVVDLLQIIRNGNYSDGAMGGGNSVNISSSEAGFSGEIPLFYQSDTRWANKMYGTATMYDSACGPTSLAMVITGLQGNIKGLDTNNDGILDPYEAACWSNSNGYRVPNVGTSHALYAALGQKVGLTVREYETSAYESVKADLKKGLPVIVSMIGHKTIVPGGGHFLVLTSIDANGNVTINDPFWKKNNNGAKFSFNAVLLEAVRFWSFDNPNKVSSNFTATAYTGRPEEGGEYGADGYYLGDKDLRHKIIAVDKSVIKLGTRVYITVPENCRYFSMPDGTKVDMNGWYTAHDTGNAIKGNIIDIYFGTDKNGTKHYVDLSNKFGRQKIIVSKIGK